MWRSNAAPVLVHLDLLPPYLQDENSIDVYVYHFYMYASTCRRTNSAQQTGRYSTVYTVLSYAPLHVLY